MPHSVRHQTMWLPSGNPDTTNIAAADMEGQGGQLGQLGQKFDYNDRVYMRVKLDSGAVAATPTGIPAVNQLLFWKDKDAYLVTNDRRFTMGVGNPTGGYRNFVAGVLRNAALGGNYIDALKKGDSVPLLDGGNTFAFGESIIAEDDVAAAADRVAVGTAVTFQRLGFARGAASGGLVNVDLDIDVEHQ